MSSQNTVNPNVNPWRVAMSVTSLLALLGLRCFALLALFCFACLQTFASTELKKYRSLVTRAGGPLAVACDRPCDEVALNFGGVAVNVYKFMRRNVGELQEFHQRTGIRVGFHSAAYTFQ